MPPKQHTLLCPYRLLRNIRGNFSEESVAVVTVDGYIDRLGKIKAENTHDRLAVYGITPGDQIHVKLVLRCV